MAPPGERKVRGPILRDATLEWLASLPANDASPRLLYLQYMEPHAPYDPPEPHRRQIGRLGGEFDPLIANTRLVGNHLGAGLSEREVDGLASLYDGEVAAVDAEIRMLFEELERRKFLDDAIIVITSDHGEEFGKYGRFLHGFTLYQSIIRVPLIIVAPGIPGGKTVTSNVSLVDVAPTLIDLLGVPAAASFEGRSLVPLLRAPAPGWWEWIVAMLTTPAPGPDVLSELEQVDSKFDGRVHTGSLVRGTTKLLVPLGGDPLLFDLTQDRSEALPLRVVAPAASSQAPLVRAWEERRSRLQERRAVAAEARPLDDATKEKLRALGYHP
jgi:arylsulfatase A-like enzyme